MLRDIHHVAFVVPSVDAAAEFLERGVGIRFLWRKAFPERGVDLAIYRLGSTFLEITAPAGPGSPLASFLARRGPGVHHVAFGVADVAESLAVLKERGCPLLDQRPAVGTSGWTVAALDTGAVLGVALQLPRFGPKRAGVDSMGRKWDTDRGRDVGEETPPGGVPCGRIAVLEGSGNGTTAPTPAFACWAPTCG